MLDKGFIYESTSLATTLLLLAVKPSSCIQICHDYKGLNTVIIKNWYPLPLVCETLDAFYSAKYFIKLDVIIAFN